MEGTSVHVVIMWASTLICMRELRLREVKWTAQVTELVSPEPGLRFRFFYFWPSFLSNSLQ